MPNDRPQPVASRDGYEIDCDRSRLQLAVIHGFLAQSYWSPGVTRETVERAIAGSDCFGVYWGDVQAGFARVITDHATFAWISDVFVLPPHRGRGIGKWLIETITGHPAYSGLRSWGLSTRDAQALYSRFGFEPADSKIILIKKSGKANPAEQHGAEVIGAAQKEIFMTDSKIRIVLKRFDAPEEVRKFEKGKFEIVHLAGSSIGRATYEPGWRWSQHVGAKMGQRYCTVEHLGYVLSGTATAAFTDGRVFELRAGEMFFIGAEPHDSWVVGNEPYVSLHVMGAGQYAKK